MGRVRSYKKIKAIDPFSKRGKSNDETVHDEPPELFEQRDKNSKKRKQFDWDNEEQREILLQREAMRSIKLTAKKETTKEVKKVEGQKEGESLREFKKRVREGMRKTLSEEVGKMTSTAKRRKEKLKERKIARKNKGKPEDYDREEVMEFSMAANGRLRPSDLGTSSSSFAKKENLSFGERVERPPDLKSFSATLNARKVKSQQLAEARTVGKKQLQRRLTQLAKDSDSGSDEEDGESEEEVPAPKKAKKQHIMDRLDMEGDDGLEQTALSAKGKIGIIHAGSHSRQAQQGEGSSSGKKQPSSMSTKNANFAEMEKIRGRVQAAYKLLRDKRRADNTFNKQNHMEKSGYVKTYGGSTNMIENWLEDTLALSFNMMNSTNQCSAMVQMKLDREEMTRLGLNKESQERIYRSFFVYVNGINEMIKDFSNVDETFSMRLWDVFLRLLDYIDPNHTESFTSYLKQSHVENLKAIQASTKVDLERTKAQNTQLSFDLAAAELKLMDMEYKLEVETLFNNTMRESQSLKVESIKFKLAEETSYHAKLNENYLVSNKEVQVFKKHIQHLTASEMAANQKLLDQTAVLTALTTELGELRKLHKDTTTQLTRCTEERDRYKVKIKELQSIRNDLTAQNRALVAEAKALTTQLAELSNSFNVSRQCNVSLTHSLSSALHTLQQYHRYSDSCVGKHGLVADIGGLKVHYDSDSLPSSMRVEINPVSHIPLVVVPNSSNSSNSHSSSDEKKHSTVQDVDESSDANATAPPNEDTEVTTETVPTELAAADTVATNGTEDGEQLPAPEVTTLAPTAAAPQHATTATDSDTADTGFDNRALNTLPQLYFVYVDTTLPAASSSVATAAELGSVVMTRIENDHSDTDLDSSSSTVFSVDQFNQSQLDIHQYLRMLEQNLLKQAESKFESNFGEVYQNLVQIVTQLPLLEEQRQTIAVLDSRVAASRLVGDVQSVLSERYHTALHSRVGECTDLNAVLGQYAESVSLLEHRVAELLLVEAKHVALQGKMQELVGLFQALVQTNADNEAQLAQATALIAQLRVTEGLYNAAVANVEQLTKECAEQKAYVEFLQKETRRLNGLLERQSSASTSCFQVFAPMHTELLGLQSDLESGITAYTSGVRVNLELISGASSSVDKEVGTGASTTGSSQLSKKDEEVKATSELVLLLKDIKYTEQEHNSIPEEQQPLIIAVIETVLGVQTSLQRLYAQCNKAVDRQEEADRLATELETLKTYYGRERRRIIRHYEEEFVSNNMRSSFDLSRAVNSFNLNYNANNSTANNNNANNGNDNGNDNSTTTDL